MPIRLACRMLRRSPWFAATTIGTVGLAISLAATVFAVVDGVLFKRLPYPAPDRVVLVFRSLDDAAKVAQSRRGTGRSGDLFTAADLESWQARDSGLSIAAFVSNFGLGPVAGLDVSTETTWAARVDRSFFDVLGVRPRIGGFRDEHFRRPFESGKLSAHPAIISDRLWRRIGGRDGALPAALLQVGDGTLDVVGVLPADFVFPAAFARTMPDVLLPLETAPGQRGLSGVGRLQSGVALASAGARLDGVVLEPAEDALGARERPIFGMTLAAVIAVVLLGSLNVAVLLSARLRDRASELAVRTALGASPGQLLTLLAAEVMVIAAAGALLGLAVAQPMLDAVLAVLPAGYLLVKPPAIDLRVLVFAPIAATSTLLTFASWPALRAARSQPFRGLRAHSGATRVGRRWRVIALSAQSAIGLLVVLSGTLLLAGFATLWRENAGIDRDGTAIVDVTSRAVQDPAQRRALLDEAVRVSARVPRVERASALGASFLRNAIGGSAFLAPAGARSILAQDVAVAAGLFSTAGIRLLRGRFLADDEILRGDHVAVVSDDLAQAYWPGTDAIGQVLSSSRGTVVIVGVVADVRIVGLEERQSTAEIYVPMGFAALSRDRTIFLRTADDPDDVARQVAAAIRQTLPQAMVTRAESVDSALAGTVRARQFQSVLFGAFACATIALFGVGMFGSVAMSTAARSREMGIRMALGATAPLVRRMVVREHLAPVMAGVIIGGAAAQWTTKLLASLIYGVAPHDLRIWALSISIVLVTALGAAWFPARRASGVEPQAILRLPS